MFAVTPDLVGLACILGDWAAPATGTIVYLYGSRVRGDHRVDCDVDIWVDFSNSHVDDMY